MLIEIYWQKERIFNFARGNYYSFIMGKCQVDGSLSCFWVFNHKLKRIFFCR